MKQPSATKKFQSKLLSFYYGNPAKDLRLVIVASDNPSPLSALIHSTIETSGEKSSLIRPTSASSLHRLLSKAWKAGANFVVIDAPTSLIAKSTFHGLPISILVTFAVAPPALAPLFLRPPEFLVLDRDDTYYPSLKDNKVKVATKTFGHHRDSDTRIDHFKPYKTAVEARLTLGNRIFDVAGFLTGDTAPSLLAAATTVADLLKIDKELIIDGLASYVPDK